MHTCHRHALTFYSDPEIQRLSARRPRAPVETALSAACRAHQLRPGPTRGPPSHSKSQVLRTHQLPAPTRSHERPSCTGYQRSALPVTDTCAAVGHAPTLPGTHTAELGGQAPTRAAGLSLDEVAHAVAAALGHLL
jgi:hypothetical protein